MTTTMPAPLPAPLPPPLLETILHRAPLDVLLFDTELICRYAVLTDGALFGRAAGQFVGQPLDAVFPVERSDIRTAIELAAGNTTSYQYPAYRYTYTDTEGDRETAFCWSVRVEPITLLDYRGRDEFRGVLVTLADVLDLTEENDRFRSENDQLQQEISRLRQELDAMRRRETVTAPPRGLRRTPHDDGASATGNRLLDALPVAEYEWLRPQWEPRQLTAQQVLYEPGALVSHVYFPVNCVLSVLTVMANGAVAETVTLGNDGMAGLGLYLGSDTALARTFCQVPGDVLQLPAAVFREAVARSDEFAWLVRRYTQVLFNQVAQTAACNSLHPVVQRCARWLLQIEDWAGTDRVPLKQEFLALMLGVQRPTVTQVAGLLREAGAIDYRRGQLQIVNRDALTAAACECYRVIQAQAARLLT